MFGVALANMLFQKTTFERLFPAGVTARGPFTETSFGFESGGKRHFVVTVAGKPRIEQGMTVIALLEKPNGWGSNGLMGWVDCLDGAVVCDNPSKFLVAASFGSYFVVMLPIRAYSVFENTDSAEMMAFSVAAIFGAFTLHFLYLSVKAFLVRRALVAVSNFSKDTSS